jgi:shikimate kinase
MKITITGPRSVGKSTISKIVAKKLKLKYYSSDNIGEKAFEKKGGLNKAMKSGLINNSIKKYGYYLITNVFKKDNFVFELSGGSITSTKYSEASKKVRETAKKNSIVVGLLPSKNIKESINFLFEREKNRKHFSKTNKNELLDKVKKDYKKFPLILKDICNFIVYTKDKTANEIADEIIKCQK